MAELENRLEVAGVENENKSAEPNGEKEKVTFSFIMKKIGLFFKNNIIFSIVILMALVSMFIVPPDSEYFDYFEWSTIATIFLILLLVAGFTNIQFFEIVARFIVKKFKNTRSIVMCMIFLMRVLK